MRKEREERDRQDAMTLGETNEQIQLVSLRLEELKDEKQQLFLRLKKVLNEDEVRKKQQQQKDRCPFLISIFLKWLSRIVLNKIFIFKRNVSNATFKCTATTAFSDYYAAARSSSADHAKSNCHLFHSTKFI